MITLSSLLLPSDCRGVGPFPSHAVANFRSNLLITLITGALSTMHKAGIKFAASYEI